MVFYKWWRETQLSQDVRMLERVVRVHRYLRGQTKKWSGDQYNLPSGAIPALLAYCVYGVYGSLLCHAGIQRKNS